MFKYYCFRLLSVIIPFIPIYLTDMFANIIGNMIYFSNNWRIKAIEHNLILINVKNFNVRKTFINMIVNYFDIIRFLYTDSRYLESIIKYEADAVVNELKQLMILTGHYGNWDIAGVFISRKLKKQSIKLITVAEYKGLGKLFDFFNKLRSKENMKVLKLEDKKIAILLMDALRNGYSPIFLIDRDITNNGMLIKFGSKNAYIPKGPYVFAKKFQLPVFIGVLTRIKNKKYRYRVVLREIKITYKSIEKDACVCIDKFVNIIHKNPEEWFAFDIKWEEK